MESIEGKFLSQVIDTPAKGDVIPDELFTSTSDLIGDIKTGVSLGCSGPALVEFTILRKRVRQSKVRPLNFRKAKFLSFAF